VKVGTTIAGFTIAAAIAGGLWWNAGQPGDEERLPTAARYTNPEVRTITSTILATGIIRLQVGAEVRVGSQLSGIVEELNVIVGSQIKRGDIIAQIDSRSLQARLDQALAQVTVLEQELRRAEVSLERAQRLDVEQLAPATDVEDRMLDLAEVRARLEKARRDAAVVETDLSYSVIRSPITGTVASVSTQKGETVAAAFTTPTFATIIAENSLELVAMVDETDIGNIEVGNPVEFTVEAYPAKDFAGVVKLIAPKGTIISGVVNFEVMIDIDSPAAVLRPDMTANVSVRTAEREALVLPTEAVQRDGFERFVFIDTDGDMTRRIITVGRREAGLTEIRQGLNVTDQVAIIVDAGAGQNGNR
jgi:HlyD family secretion protein